ncbi:MAG: hypothetical protein HYS15_01500 [Candidatus Spechtbacteria bacterium]|nr:hypothetical protein [Candidatus Spechtbacteria bacterium]
MMKSEEVVNCGPSRDTINKFLALPGNEQSNLSGDQGEQLVRALAHIEMCYHGYNEMNPCHKLWHKLLLMIDDPQSGEYNRDLAMYFAHARIALRPDSPWPQQEPGIDY